jgi:hypothetical protein
MGCFESTAVLPLFLGKGQQIPSCEFEAAYSKQHEEPGSRNRNPQLYAWAFYHYDDWVINMMGARNFVLPESICIADSIFRNRVGIFIDEILNTSLMKHGKKFVDT